MPSPKLTQCPLSLGIVGLAVVSLRVYPVGMRDNLEVTPGAAETRERDRERVAQICRAPRGSNEMSRVLFFEHFERIEKRLQRRLRDRGLQYDDGCEYYNAVLERIYERVYAPESLRKAIDDFDADRGSLQNWLLGRVVFAIRDWLKTSQAAPSRSTAANTEQLADESAEETETQGDAVLERALPRMTAAQRACTVLRVLPARYPNQEDVAVIAEAAGRQLDDVQGQIDALTQQFGGSEIGVREEKLLAQLSFWHSQNLHQRRLYQFYRRRLLENGTRENELARIENRAGRLTQDEITAHYAVIMPADGRTKTDQTARRRYALCCHELIRCDRRLKKLTGEYAGAPSVHLMSYEEIAEVLGSTVAKVTASLNRARQHLEDRKSKEYRER